MQDFVRGWKRIHINYRDRGTSDVQLEVGDSILNVIRGTHRIELFDPELIAAEPLLHCWLSRNEVLIVCGPYSPKLYRISLKDDLCEEVDYLNRVDETAPSGITEFIVERPAPDESLLLLYEQGILCIEQNGFVRWHRHHDDFSAMFGRMTPDEICIERQFPYELAGEETCFRLNDGRRVGF